MSKKPDNKRTPADEKNKPCPAEEKSKKAPFQLPPMPPFRRAF